MLTQETKRHIDAARQVLVGVVPNPSSQIDQITNALIYKFMDDMDQSAIKAGGDPSFFVGDLERYAWTRLMDLRLGNQDRMNLYSEALIKFSESKKLPELFRGIFKSAFLPYRSPEVLGLFLKEIDYFDYSHSEELGNAYEYLLSIMGSQGDAGQFRTPRHIIDFIAAAVHPTKDDKVLDPACGTAGFLVSAYKHILEQHDGKNPLTPDQRRAIMNNFEGYDVDPGMVRISQVNMYLHNFRNPKIYNYNTLSQDERWADKLDVILANPPFMSPRGGVSTHNRFSVQSSRSEVLFVDYIMNHLRPKGRAGIIVPEGIIFQSGTAHKQLRKNLVEDGLYAVVSLPSGVFQPYAGVKTSILLLDNELAKRNKEILFIKIENDGFDLGANRRPINKNDLPQALEIIREWQSSFVIQTVSLREAVATKQTFTIAVSKEKIADSGDYNLSGDRYRVATDYTNAKWPMVELGKVIQLNFGERITKNKKKGTKYPVYGGGGESFRTDEFNRENEYVIARFAMSENCVRYVSGQFWLMDSGGTFSIKTEYQNKLNKNFVGKILQSCQEDIFMCSRGGAQKNLNNDHFYELKIPLPPLEVQQQIVAEIDGYQNIITGARQVAENWKPKIDIDSEWEKVKLGDVCEINPKKSEIKNINNETEISFIPMADLSLKAAYFEAMQIKKLSEVMGSYTYFVENDVLLARVTPCFENGKAGIARNLKNKIGFGSSEYIVLRPTKRILPEIIYAYITADNFNSNGRTKMTGTGGLQRVPISFVENWVIYLPSLKVQKQIVGKIEAERALVESAKKLIGIYEQKTKGVLSKLWVE